MSKLDAMGYSYVETKISEQNDCHSGVGEDLLKLKRSIELENGDLEMNYENENIGVVGEKYGVKFTIQGVEDTFSYYDKEDFLKRSNALLDHIFGIDRVDSSDDLEGIWCVLSLGKSVGKSSRAISKSLDIASNDEGLLEFEDGKHTLDDTPPATYLLVRNANSGGFYCLSFVQEAYDMMYGYGEAKKIGLYLKKNAKDLDFSKNSNVISYTEDFPEYEPGMILRMKRRFSSGDESTHIGIIGPKGNILHIVGDKFYSDSPGLDLSLAMGFKITEVIVPKNKEIGKIEIRETNSSFKRGLSLEALSPKLKRSRALKLGRDKANLAYIEETMYQLNKDRFEYIEGKNGRDSLVRLTNDSKLKIPKSWYK